MTVPQDDEHTAPEPCTVTRRQPEDRADWSESVILWNDSETSASQHDQLMAPVHKEFKSSPIASHSFPSTEDHNSASIRKKGPTLVSTGTTCTHTSPSAITVVPWKNLCRKKDPSRWRWVEGRKGRCLNRRFQGRRNVCMIWHLPEQTEKGKKIRNRRIHKSHGQVNHNFPGCKRRSSSNNCSPITLPNYYRKTSRARNAGTRHRDTWKAGWDIGVFWASSKNFSCSEHEARSKFDVDSGASMHMISTKDSSDAEMDTLTKSCGPATVINANGEVQTHEEATVYVKESDIFLTMKVLENTPAVLSLGKLCDEHGYSYEWINGLKPHLIKNGIRIQCNSENFVPIVVPGLSTSSCSSLPSSTSMTPSRQEIDHPKSSSSLVYLTTHDIFNTNKAGNWSSQVFLKPRLPHHPWHLQLCQANVWIDKNGETRTGWITIPQSCHVNVWKGKNRETRALLTRQKSCWLNQPQTPNQIKIRITSEYGETRVNPTFRVVNLNHRYAVVVQDLATQWIQSYQCKTKTSQEIQRSLQKFLGPDRIPEVIYADNSLEFGKACEDLSWNHCTSTPDRSETDGIAERAVRRVKESTSAVLLQSGLNESWSADSMECYTYLRNVRDILSDGKTPYERRCGQPFNGPIIPFGSLVEYHLITAKDQSRKSYLDCSSDTLCTRGEFGRVT